MGTTLCSSTSSSVKSSGEIPENGEYRKAYPDRPIDFYTKMVLRKLRQQNFSATRKLQKCRKVSRKSTGTAWLPASLDSPFEDCLRAGWHVPVEQRSLPKGVDGPPIYDHKECATSWFTVRLWSTLFSGNPKSKLPPCTVGMNSTPCSLSSSSSSSNWPKCSQMCSQMWPDKPRVVHTAGATSIRVLEVTPTAALLSKWSLASASNVKAKKTCPPMSIVSIVDFYIFLPNSEQIYVICNYMFHFLASRNLQCGAACRLVDSTATHAACSFVDEATSVSDSWHRMQVSGQHQCHAVTRSSNSKSGDPPPQMTPSRPSCVWILLVHFPDSPNPSGTNWNNTGSET